MEVVEVKENQRSPLAMIAITERWLEVTWETTSPRLLRVFSTSCLNREDQSVCWKRNFFKSTGWFVCLLSCLRICYFHSKIVDLLTDWLMTDWLSWGFSLLFSLAGLTIDPANLLIESGLSLQDVAVNSQSPSHPVLLACSFVCCYPLT